MPRHPATNSGLNMWAICRPYESQGAVCYVVTGQFQLTCSRVQLCVGHPLDNAAGTKFELHVAMHLANGCSG